MGWINSVFARLLGLFGFAWKRNYFYDLLCIPDLFIGWIPTAVFMGRKLIKKHDIDLIYVSCSPFSSGIIGWWLKKLTKLPLVVDYRDPYGLDIGKYQEALKPTRFRGLIDRWITGAVLKASDLFTVTTEETRELYVEQFSFVRGKIHTIHNGFDQFLLENIGEYEKFSKFTIIYTGNFYYNIEFYYFFEGLGQLKKEGKINSENFQFLFYGGDKVVIQHVLARYDIADIVRIRSRIPYDEILKEIKCSHLQLLRIMQPMISTKLFEGIALNVPFIATIPQGEVEGIVKKFSTSSYVIIENSAKSVSRCIEQAIFSEKNDVESNKVELFFRSLSRERLSINMLNLFDSLLDHEESI